MKQVSAVLSGRVDGDYLHTRFYQARQNSGLSAKEAADKIGLSVGHLRKLEKGGVQMVADPATIVRAAKAYGVSDVWLYAGAIAGHRFVPDWYRCEALEAA